MSECVFVLLNPPPPAMYSVEIKVERDRMTGETRVLSTNTTLPVDLSHQGVKVYEDEQKGEIPQTCFNERHHEPRGGGAKRFFVPDAEYSICKG